MSTRKFALFGGIIMLLIGGLSLLPMLTQHPDTLPALKVTISYDLFLGFFPMNIFNKIALLLFGAAGILASRATSFFVPLSYARIVFLVMAPLAILGLIPATSTLFGYWPLFGGEIVGHGVFGLLGAYFGYVAPANLRGKANSI